jgi:hypothetical protein
MSWSIARPSDKEPTAGSRPPAQLGPLLGASAVALVVLGVLSLLEATDVEPFGGSASVLAGLLAGSALVVAGLTGVARRHKGPARVQTDGRERLEARSVDAGPWPVEGARHDWVAATRMMRVVDTPPPPPPPPPRQAATSRAAPPPPGTASTTNGRRPSRVPGGWSSRTSA